MQSGPTRKRSPKSAAMITKDDIVMLECNVNRFKPTTGPGSKRTGKGWDVWNVALELIDILYLFQAPDVKTELVDTEIEAEGEEY